MEAEGVQDVPSKVSINGQEYDSSEAETLIGLGNKTRENEQKWNTSIDRVWPEYGKSQTTIKQLQSELEGAKRQLQDFTQKQTLGTETNLDVQKAKEAARQLGLVLQEDISDKYVTREQALEIAREQRESERAVEAVLKSADSLEAELNGQDGRPRFNKRHVLAYANTYGISDLKQAYEEMYDTELKSWKDSRIQERKSPGLKTIPTGGTSKEPKNVNITDDNVRDALREAMGGS